MQDQPQRDRFGPLRAVFGCRRGREGRTGVGTSFENQDTVLLGAKSFLSQGSTGKLPPTVQVIIARTVSSSSYNMHKVPTPCAIFAEE